MFIVLCSTTFCRTFSWEQSRWLVDFSKVRGLDGIYIANVYWDAYNGEEPQPDTDSEVHTLISFNKGESCSFFLLRVCLLVFSSVRTCRVYFHLIFFSGGDWDEIAAPEGTTCTSRDECQLHLNGPTTSQFGRVYSDEDAIGLVMATGNVGQSLSDSGSNTFLSRDAGLTWSLVEFGMCFRY